MKFIYLKFKAKIGGKGQIRIIPSLFNFFHLFIFSYGGVTFCDLNKGHKAVVHSGRIAKTRTCAALKKTYLSSLFSEIKVLVFMGLLESF